MSTATNVASDNEQVDARQESAAFNGVIDGSD
jgi:hypothetical protein